LDNPEQAEGAARGRRTSTFLPSCCEGQNAHSIGVCYNMDKRSLYYWSRKYSKGIHAGDNYKKLPQVVVINILGAEFLPIEEVHSSFHLWEDGHKDFMLTDVLEMHFIDMVKFRRLKEKDIEGNTLHRRLAFFDKNTDENTLKKITTMEPAIEKAMWKINNVLQGALKKTVN
jgi:predicted transposase/invertase (TIGR01784 family)